MKHALEVSHEVRLGPQWLELGQAGLPEAAPPHDIPARVAALEGRIGTLETRVAALEAIAAQLPWWKRWWMQLVDLLSPGGRRGV